jgi:hypothetical protein
MAKRTSTGTRGTHRDPRGNVPDVLTQLRCAMANPLATAIGAVVGGVIPWFARTVAHGEVSARWWADPKALIVIGCMLFSVSTVYSFGRATFRAPRKALGFVIAIEGVAVLCSTPQVWVTALALLVMINAVTSGCTIAVAHAETRRRSAASALGHARSRAARTARGQAAGETTTAVREGSDVTKAARSQAAGRARRATQETTEAEVVAWRPAKRTSRALVRLDLDQDMEN